MADTVPESWRATLGPVLALPESRRLGGWLRAEEERGAMIYPPRGTRLRAFELTPLEEIKVVIVGQDPYHGPGQAHGLCFSVPDGIRVPPSLLNIYKELESDLGVARRDSGNLEHWARQGVLLLNTSLTVEAGKAGSHAGKGWEAITGAALAAVAAREVPSVFVLWGNHARKKAASIPELAERGPHLVLASAHPSPLSAHAGFFGSKPFSKANAFLEATSRGAIDW
jgi:uracil-DNA glycosylase